MKKRDLQSLTQKMLAHYGPLHWWPAETPFEVMVGAILTQNTSWSQVEKAIANLKANKVLEPKAMLALPPNTLAALIRPAGFFRVKTKRLRSFLQFFLETYEGDAIKMKRVSLSILREQLLAVHGIGPETADSILLYALQKPIFVVDAYTHRILKRHFLCAEETSYEELQELFMDHLDPDVSAYNEFHAQLVQVGKDFCRTKPKCSECPLNGFKWNL